MNRALHVFANTIFWIVMAALFALACGFFWLRVINGGNVYTILTGSMQPTINPGDMIVAVHPSGVEDIATNDIVVFQPESNNPEVITHRVTSVDRGNETFITQGDANNMSDGEMVEEQLVGKVVFTIPKIGYATQWVRENIGVVVVALIAVFVGYTVGEKIVARKRRTGEKTA